MRLKISDVTMRYGKLTALQGVHSSADGGKVIAVLGPNASGKTTLLRTIAGLTTPSKGRVELDGVRVDKMTPHDRASKISWVPRIAEVSGAFTIRTVVELGRYAIGPSESRVTDALRQVELLDRSESLWHGASAGMRQRAAMARALAQRTPGGMLVLDEPSSALDMHHLKSMGEMLKQCASEGDIVIAALHDISFAMEIADAVIVLKEGRIVLDGQTNAVLTPSSLGGIYGVDLNWAVDEAGKRHLVIA
ncbi:MAG: ABC transporter ATP-binding protein [Phycisphaerae bacterium]|jgi:iron complex transport system ATP-binding protein|nr:ABC transporter ATP-binding protein [Phycisphaerae bacterium]MBT5408878.1 ABC transporter ATP-binding protein [Phycisphaerae bacterium]MBT6165619.1 ABC transporter ATP-binding protein [Phycisphaerae bacterium]MBT7658545.1 ABC transporter ATP-binding protein [Phycisphaerae bacterium]